MCVPNRKNPLKKQQEKSQKGLEMEFPKKMGQTADQTEQMYGPATVFMPLSLYFPTFVLQESSRAFQMDLGWVGSKWK